LYGSWVSSTNKTDRHDIAEILLKVALNTIKQTSKSILYSLFTIPLEFYFKTHLNEEKKKGLTGCLLNMA
jgi:hypothetical protein